MSDTSKSDGPSWGRIVLRSAIGTFVGGVIGTLFLPGAGTAVGAKIGAILAGASGGGGDAGDAGGASIDFS